jgi:hypothetical protein
MARLGSFTAQETVSGGEIVEFSRQKPQKKFPLEKQRCDEKLIQSACASTALRAEFKPAGVFIVRVNVTSAMSRTLAGGATFERCSALFWTRPLAFYVNSHAAQCVSLRLPSVRILCRISIHFRIESFNLRALL